jgi:hypothetical protein
MMQSRVDDHSMRYSLWCRAVEKLVGATLAIDGDEPVGAFENDGGAVVILAPVPLFPGLIAPLETTLFTASALPETRLIIMLSWPLGAAHQTRQAQYTMSTAGNKI